MADKPDWHEIGYNRAFATLTGSKIVNDRYPTRDIWSEQDEMDFCAGYNLAVKDWQEKGGNNSIAAYAMESEERNA